MGVGASSYLLLLICYYLRFLGGALRHTALSQLRCDQARKRSRPIRVTILA